MNKVLHIYYSTWSHESRAWRAGELVLSNKLADQVVYAGHRAPGFETDAERNSREKIVRLPPYLDAASDRRSMRILGLARWWRALVAMFGADKDIVLIHAHGLASMPAAAMLKWKLGVPLLYDAHELETERDGWGQRTKRIARFVEENVIWRADHTIVVGDAIRKWYAKTYPGLKLSLIRNIPAIPAATGRAGSLRAALNIPSDDLVCIYCGIISASRGTRELLQVFKSLPENKHLVFVGYGDDVEMLKAECAQTPNIHYHPAVPSDQVVDFIREADLGVIFLVSDALSYRYAMPNKLFEYSAAGLAILCNDGDEMKEFVETYRLGWVAPASVEAFIEILRRLDRPSVKAVSANSDRNFPAASDEQARLLDILKDLVASR